MPRFTTHLLLALLMLFPSFTLAACFSGDAPAETAERFVTALATNDFATLQEVVDPAMYEQVMTSVMLQMGLTALVGGGSEIVELAAETVSGDDANAVVAVTGKMKTSALGVSMTTPLNMRLTLAKRGDRWLVTGGQ